MDRDFTWNISPNRDTAAGQIRDRIDELKAERAQLVAQLGDEYGDERLGAQMLRAGDEGDMYKFLRGQKDARELQLAEKDKTMKPTQEQFDKVLETLQATAAAVEDPNLDPRVKSKYDLMLENYRSQLNEMLTKNPDLSMRNYDPYGNGEEGNSGSILGGDLYQLKQKLGWEGTKMTDKQIDALAAQLKNNPNVSADEVNKIVKEAKDRNETAYRKYVGEVERINAQMKSIYDAYTRTHDGDTQRTLEALLGDYLDPKTRNFKKKKPSSKDNWLKGK